MCIDTGQNSNSFACGQLQFFPWQHIGSTDHWQDLSLITESIVRPEYKGCVTPTKINYLKGMWYSNVL